MSSTSDNSKNQQKVEYWGETPQLSHEQIIEWLDGHRQWMFEIWKNDPAARKKWEAINSPPHRK